MSAGWRKQRLQAERRLHLQSERGRLRKPLLQAGAAPAHLQQRLGRLGLLLAGEEHQLLTGAAGDDCGQHLRQHSAAQCSASSRQMLWRHGNEEAAQDIHPWIKARSSFFSF